MLRYGCAALAAGLVSLAAHAQSNSVQSLDHVQLDRHRSVVRVGFKQPLAQPPSGFRTLHPVARIVLEFPDTSAEPRRSIDVERGLLRSIGLVQQGARARLVIRLARPAGFETAIEGNYLLITVSGAPSGLARGELRSIEFKRGAQGEGVITVNLSDPSVGVDIRQQGRQLIADFADTELPPQVRQRLDVLDFATPVGTVTAFPSGRSARLVIEPVSRFEYSAYQSGRDFVVSLAPVREAVVAVSRWR